MNHRTTVLFLAALTLPALFACSEQYVSQEWELWVAGNNTCDTAADCVIVGPGCPLGCWSAVNAAAEQAAQEEAQRLIDMYQAGGRACVYSCMGPVEAVCEGNRCAVGDVVQ